MDASEDQTSANTNQDKRPWWLATTSPTVAVVLTVIWAGLFLWSALAGGTWDAFHIVRVSVTALLTTVYAITAGYLARRG